MSVTEAESTTPQGTHAKPRRAPSGGGQGGAVYGLGMIGALVYYWRHAQDGGGRAAAVGKALAWPAFVVYGLLEHLSDR